LPILSRLLEAGAARGVTLIEGSREVGGASSVCGVAITGFVELTQARAWIEQPPTHLVDHVFECERAGEPVLLRPARVATENASSGMALAFLAFALGADLKDASGTKQIALMHEGFRLFHAGYYCPLAIHPAPHTPIERESLVGTSFQPAGDGSSVWFLDTTTIARAPYHPLTAVMREFPPQLEFSPSEREMLFRAVLGYADAEIAEELSVSVETVRKRWRNIFQRVTDHSELRILPANRNEPTGTTRGPEKRRALLEYLASHLEELRPYAVQRDRGRTPR